MTEHSETSASEPGAQDTGQAAPLEQQAAPLEQQAAAWVPEPLPPPSAQASAADRPELMMGAAFAGGLLGALILKRLAR
jgi:hypothetical protein